MIKLNCVRGINQLRVFDNIYNQEINDIMNQYVKMEDIMEIYDKLIKPITEVNYLRAENVERYRLIIRYFFLEHERIQYWLHKEDVYEQLHRIPSYEDYTLEQCQQDLQALVNWNNLTAIQDSNKVRTIEDFKNKKYRYQLTEYTVRIERMVQELENLENEGASLEPTLLERIYQQLLKINTIKDKDPVEINGWLHLLMNDFIRLNQNYQDYIKTLNSARAEELMKTTEFLVYKDKIVMYLRSFVMMMQDKGNAIAGIIGDVNDEDLQQIFASASKYEISIPRIDKELNYDNVYQNFKEKWRSLCRWFYGLNSGSSEMDRLYDISNEIIRKMTRYAQQISEMINRGSNRKEQYIKIASIFGQCQNINEAHCMSAYIFGVEDILHLNHIEPRVSEDINTGVYLEKPSEIIFDPHSKIVRKKAIRQPAKNYQEQRQKEKEKRQEQARMLKEKIEKLIIDEEIDFAKLPIIEPEVRKVLLTWLSKALSQSSLSAKNDYGEVYFIDKSMAEQSCILQCRDGDFEMPAFKISFKEKTNE